MSLIRLGPGDLLAALGELDCAQAAPVYAALGFFVVPMHTARPGGRCSCRDQACPDPGKHPRLRGWTRLTAADPTVVGEWWRRWPDANLALATGRRFDVLDVDGEQGVEALRAVLSIAPAEHPGPVARTGGGGWHLLYAPTGLGNRVKFLPGVDWRGRGGLIVAPPSEHTSGHGYSWVRPLTAALPEVPADLWRRLTPAAAARTTLPPAPAPAGHSGGYGRAALARERAAVAAAQPGRRNATLNRAAFNLGQLVAAPASSTSTRWGPSCWPPPWRPATPKPRPGPPSPPGWPVGRPNPAATGSVPHDGHRALAGRRWPWPPQP
jgi:Bifunctional DNA primase/polymerase, N-terminal